jgi:autotransporter-associated beta strand protein
VLQIGNSGALGAGDVNVADSSTLQAGASGLALGNNLILGQTVAALMDNNGQNLTWNGTVSGGGALIKIGRGTLALNGNNSYSGNTTVNAGALSISSPANMASPEIILNNGGDLLGSGTFAITNAIGIGPTSDGTSGTALIDGRLHFQMPQGNPGPLSNAANTSGLAPAEPELATVAETPRAWPQPAPFPPQNPGRHLMVAGFLKPTMAGHSLELPLHFWILLWS